MDDARSQQTHIGLMLIDLINLGRINHYHGYVTGDQLLQATYEQLLELTKLPDSIFRVGGHRFAFILRDLGNPAYIALAINRVTRSLEVQLQGETDSLRADVKIGIAVNHSGRTESMATLAQAEASLTHVKLGGLLQIEDVLAQDTSDPGKIRLEQSLVEALYDNAFQLYFQPKVEIATGKLRSAEALLRWTSPDGEEVSPEYIVEWAESTGRSYELTKWVIHHAVRQLKRWQVSSDISLAVNIPASLAGDPDLPSLLHDVLGIWGVAPGKIIIELTEGAVIKDKQSGFDNLLKIRNMGINISIDDFGTGYSSLSYFKHIPAGELKIDRAFVESMRTNEQDMELVKVILYIAHQFDMKVVAEGVEDEETLNLLGELGCDFAQGYYFSRPLPLQEFEAVLSRQNWLKI